MDSRFSLAAFLSIALVPQSSFCRMAFLTSSQLGSEARNTSTSSKDPRMSDREKAGLRGPVKRCTEERVTLAVGGYPEMKFSYTTEYDPGGKILSTRSS